MLVYFARQLSFVELQNNAIGWAFEAACYSTIRWGNQSYASKLCYSQQLFRGFNQINLPLFDTWEDLTSVGSPEGRTTKPGCEGVACD
jgi:hypothetical protein